MLVRLIKEYDLLTYINIELIASGNAGNVVGIRTHDVCYQS